MNTTQTATPNGNTEKAVVTRQDVEQFLRELRSSLTDATRTEADHESARQQIAHVEAVLAPESEFALACAMHVPFSRCEGCLHVPLA